MAKIAIVAKLKPPDHRDEPEIRLIERMLGIEAESHHPGRFGRVDRQNGRGFGGRGRWEYQAGSRCRRPARSRRAAIEPQGHA